MKKIIRPREISEIRKKLSKKGNKIVLVGGCFDILHRGHVVFLEKAKAAGDVLFVLLESDKRIRELKGRSRPVNTQKDRAIVLASFSTVDYVILLPSNMTDEDYDDLVCRLKPQKIATTEGDVGIKHKERTAKLVGAEVVMVTPRISDYSTSRIVSKISNTVK